MMRSARFWIPMTLFQIAFGLSVFAVTRHHYIRDVPAPGNDRPAQAVPSEWTESGNASGLEELISSFPGQPDIVDPVQLAARADEFFVNRQYPQAADLYQQLLATDPGNVDTYNNLGITLHYIGRSDEALQILNQGVSVDPEYQRIWLTLGYVNSQAGSIPQARAALTTAVELGPDTDVGKSAAEMLRALGPG
jgi:tetratricopeptide (TPR) repeat protein